MRAQRFSLAVALFGLLLGGLLAPASVARAAVPPIGGLWSSAPPLQVARTAHTATTLADGRVLVAGVGSSELYNPATGVWSGPTPMLDKRYAHTATLLPNGQVLVVGGVAGGNNTIQNMVERYDPATDRWSAAASPRTARAFHTATLLRDGRVLVAGGGPYSGGQQASASAEIYDPATDRWSPGGVMGVPRSGHSATMLRDGRVLVVGGNGNPGLTTGSSTAELFDPSNGAWSPVAALTMLREEHAAALLADGRVLVSGGRDLRATETAELFDPTTGRWTLAAAMRTPRVGHSATALPNGQVLVAGGGRGYNSSSATAELYDPATNSWTLTGPLPARLRGQRAALLPDGRVLLAGGDETQRAATLYTDTAPPVACFAETDQCLRGRFLEYWQQHGGLTINGYPLSDELVETLEDGREYQVQYFERARFEYHPENPAPFDVLLGAFGRRLHPVNPAFPTQGAAQPLPGATYFPQTGHNLQGALLEYWNRNGGLAQFGYPLGEEVREQLEDGNLYTVQYFERARLELHPEQPPPYGVLLGQFGRRILAESQLLTGPVGQLYRINGGLRDRLGAPRTAIASTAGALQDFEKGWLLYRADTRQIYAICFSNGIENGAWSAYPDTWAEGQPDGGRPGPYAGLYEPRRGFGKVWRENPAVRQCLGYARSADEQAATLQVQPFAGGLVLFTTTMQNPAGQIFVLYADGSYQSIYPPLE